MPRKFKAVSQKSRGSWAHAPAGPRPPQQALTRVSYKKYGTYHVRCMAWRAEGRALLTLARSPSYCQSYHLALMTGAVCTAGQVVVQASPLASRRRKDKSRSPGAPAAATGGASGGASEAGR